jgi:PmbA protein
MKIDKDLKQLTENLVAYGQKKGADQVEVLITESSDFSASVLQGKIEKLTEAGSKSAAIKVIKEERVLNVSSSDLNLETLRGLIDRSVKRAPLLNPDPFSALPDKEDIKVDPESLKIYDEAIATLSPQKKIERAIIIEKIATADKRVKKSFGAEISSFAGINYLANSNGFSQAYRRTSMRCGIFLQSGEGDNLFDEGKSDFSRSLAGLMSPEALAKEAVHRVTRLIGAQKIATETMPVVLEPNQAAVILRFLNTCVSGSNVFRKQSFLADKLNTKIGADLITVVDDGLLPGAPGTKPYDSEGVPVRKTIVVEKGTLKSFLMDTYSARKLKMKSTGNGSGPNNLHIQPGKHTPEEMIKSVDRGLLLTGTMAFGMNSSTGNISKGAFGMLIEKGEVTRPIAEITISGNLGEVLKNITMIGNDLKFTGSVVAPSMLVSELVIGGK